ncbi:FO synthase subunit 2 (fragment) [groundwater metagenome]|uniref:FO synthase subunit 2 n=1 Tax=groundwater metagenome TaxID=717931 RepID=A0A098E7K6_9ZZZZ
MKFNPEISEILERAVKGEKISEKDGIALMNSNALLNLGIAADKIRKQKVGDIVSFVLNLHINYTNICVSKCGLCAYYKNKVDSKGYVMSINEILESIKKARQISNISEVHIVGSLNDEIQVEYYENILIETRKNFPNLAIKAFTATEIFFIAKQNKSTVKEILERFKDAGLNFMPGGGAEILNDEIRNKICPNKLKSDEWLNVMETAHKLGIRSNATMLYGHIESNEDRVGHILKLRDLQEKQTGFWVLIPSKVFIRKAQICTRKDL